MDEYVMRKEFKMGEEVFATYSIHGSEKQPQGQSRTIDQAVQRLFVITLGNPQVNLENFDRVEQEYARSAIQYAQTDKPLLSIVQELPSGL